MRAFAGLSKAVFGVSIASCIFLAFGWPFLVSADPADGLFRILAVGSLLAFLASLTGLTALGIAGRGGRPQAGG